MPKHLNSRNIFFIRHGQSESNVNENMAAGMNYDAPLTELGKKQAIINAYVAFFWTFVLQGANGAIIYYGAVLVEKGEITVG